MEQVSEGGTCGTWFAAGSLRGGHVGHAYNMRCIGKVSHMSRGQDGSVYKFPTEGDLPGGMPCAVLGGEAVPEAGSC